MRAGIGPTPDMVNQDKSHIRRQCSIVFPGERKQLVVILLRQVGMRGPRERRGRRRHDRLLWFESRCRGTTAIRQGVACLPSRSGIHVPAAGPPSRLRTASRDPCPGRGSALRRRRPTGRECHAMGWRADHSCRSGSLSLVSPSSVSPSWRRLAARAWPLRRHRVLCTMTRRTVKEKRTCKTPR